MTVTATTERVRALYSYALGKGNPPAWVKRRMVAFDRWLTGVEREAAAKELEAFAGEHKKRGVTATTHALVAHNADTWAAEYREGKR